MPHNVYLVFSKPPEGLPDAEYQRWYAAHVRENVETPGFVSAQRYQVSGVVQSGDVAFSHLAAYEYDGDILELRRHLDSRREAGEIVLPEWFGDIRFGTWTCLPLEGRVAAPGAGK